jgi:hypothetical protein
MPAGDHIHDDPEQLTFACPACIDRVQRDQHLAAVAEQPDRPLTVAWTTEFHEGTNTYQVKYLDSEQPRDVAERNSHRLPEFAEIQEAAFGKKL